MARGVEVNPMDEHERGEWEPDDAYDYVIEAFLEGATEEEIRAYERQRAVQR